MGSDWVRWHQEYELPGSGLARRLAVVRCHLWRALGEAPREPSGERRLLSLCAGDGRDVLPVLAAHPAGRDVRALLIELNPELADRARRTARRLGLERAEVWTADAGAAGTYRDVDRSHIVLVCGVFGNVSSTDMRRTVAALPSLTVVGGVVVWTRGRGWDTVDRSDEVRAGFAAYGFRELAFVRPGNARFRVGTTQLAGWQSAARPGPAAPAPDGRLFTFL